MEAGYAGAPFVQPEHEEEWMEWVDWAQVEGQASGSSSNLAAMFDGHSDTLCLWGFRVFLRDILWTSGHVCFATADRGVRTRVSRGRPKVI